MKQSEFQDFNNLNLEPRFIKFEEIGGIEPFVFKKRIKSIIACAVEKVKNKAISNITRSLLFQIITEGNKAMRDGSHKAMVDFYYNAYKDAITQGNMPEFTQAWQWDYIVDNKDTQSATQMLDSVEGDIRKLNTSELTNQFNQKSNGLSGFGEMGSELSLPWKVAILGGIGYGLWFWHKKKFAK